MKRALKIIVPLMLLVVLCAATCPNTEKHSEKIKKEFGEHLNKKLGIKGDQDPDAEFKQFSSFLGGGMMSMFLENNIAVKNYGVCSVGYIKFRGKSHKASFGILGTVVTVSFDDIQKQLFGF